MAGRLLALVITASVQINQITAAEPNAKDPPSSSIYHGIQAACSSQEDSCSKEKYLCSNENKGTAELLIDDLNFKLRDAELELRNTNKYPQHYDLQDGEEFDFIVVGAGSAGAVVANRLSEVEDWKVLLVEAGGDPPITSEFPAFTLTLQGTDVDWQYKTDHEEENCLGMVGNRCKWPRGKMLGGSSSINYMMHTRGHPKDFDGWAAAGNKGWSYEEVLPYFKKSENLKDPAAWAMEGADKYHSTDGLLSVEPWPDNELIEAINVLADGLEDLGYPYNPDCNGKKLTGFTRMPGALRDYRRCSTAKAFLSSAKERANIFLTKHALATKILIDTEMSKTYGIHLTTKEGKTLEVRAKKEIIVSAGAINSPQLLMLSGIGPTLHLHDLGIPVVKDLPVGENLQDHPLMITIVLTTNLSVSLSPPSFEDTFKFLFKHPSRLSSMGSFPYAVYINTVPGIDYPDIELLQHHIPKNNKQDLVTLLSNLFNLKQSAMEEYIKINENAHTVLMLASMMRPYSRGRILLKSTDPLTHPKIVAGTLSDKRDVDTYLRIYDFISRLINTDALIQVDGKLHEIRVSACEKHPLASSKYRECAMRHLTGTTYHVSGTCKMGPSGDPTAVVDPSLRVHGVEGLRVVDASVMPTITSAHINAAVIMIGEKAADMIIQEWKSV